MVTTVMQKLLKSVIDRSLLPRFYGPPCRCILGVRMTRNQPFWTTLKFVDFFYRASVCWRAILI